MRYLSWMFFCLAPFGLFCSESGNGLILCPIFIILGFVFKWLENNSSKTPKAIVKVEPRKFWEWHYKSFIGNWGVNYDKDARKWATYVAQSHNCWVPPEEEQERIARENGIITYEIRIEEENKRKEKEAIEKKRKEEEDNKWDRLQVGKYYLMWKLMNKYKRTMFGKKGKGNTCYFPDMTIERTLSCFRFADDGCVGDYGSKGKFNKTCKEMWETSLTYEEKKEATKWIKEYEERLLREINDYIEKGIPMPTIEKHRYDLRYICEELNKQYGFIK